jgi:HlyD family secretion protein
MKHWLRNLFILLIVAALLTGATMWYTKRGDAAPTGFTTVPVARGDLVATISATGTVEPEDAIDVGAQVQGRIIGFGKDIAGKSVDNNSEVDEGMVLALIDPSVYQSQVDQADAQLKQAQSSVERAKADLGQFQAKLNQATRDWDRAQKIGRSDALSDVDYDAYQSAFESAKANVAVGQAAIDQASATVSQSTAALKQAKQNLGYCTITAPVKGVIITRRVNIGQTVVSSLSAPSLFLIAKDLTRMQLWTAVNEADIGNIKVGQEVTFTVDARGNRKFKGTVTKVRLDAQMTQNVVTYTVEITTDNDDRALIPYLTANVSFQVAKKDDVLLVPNVALRWTPSDQSLIAPDARNDATSDSPRPRQGGSGSGGSASGGGGAGGGGAGAGGNPSRAADSAAPTSRPARASSGGDHARGVVWVEDGNFIRPVKLHLGVTDSVNTEVISGELTEGQKIITGDAPAGGSASDDARNPFAPQFRGRRPGGR